MVKHEGAVTIAWLIDDDEGYRGATSWLLNTVGINVKAYASADAFLAEFDPYVAGCIITDLRMPGIGGLSLQSRIREASAMPILFVSGHGEVGSAVAAMKGGAVDFLEKPVDENLFIERVQAAIQRDIDRRAVDLEADAWEARLATLTPREKEVMAWVLRGLAGKQIAHRLGISVKTVEVHKTNILRKLEAGSWLAVSGDLPEGLRESIKDAVKV